MGRVKDHSAAAAFAAACSRTNFVIARLSTLPDPSTGNLSSTRISAGIISSAAPLAPRERLEVRALRARLLGDQHESLALARIGDRRDRRHWPGQSSAASIFDGGKRDHLAADLGEPLGAALDGDEAFGIDGDDIAGIVPAFRWRLDHPRLVGVEIAKHDVRPPHVEPAALIDARDLLEPRLMPGSSRPTVPNLLNIGVLSASTGAVSVTP